MGITKNAEEHTTLKTQALIMRLQKVVDSFTTVADSVADIASTVREIQMVLGEEAGIADYDMSENITKPVVKLDVPTNIPAKVYGYNYNKGQHKESREMAIDSFNRMFGKNLTSEQAKVFLIGKRQRGKVYYSDETGDSRIICIYTENKTRTFQFKKEQIEFLNEGSDSYLLLTNGQDVYVISWKNVLLNDDNSDMNFTVSFRRKKFYSDLQDIDLNQATLNKIQADFSRVSGH